MSSSPLRVLLVECPDEPGLVHAITGVLFRHRCNVTENAQFVDEAGGHFFMRTVFSGEIDTARVTAEANAILPSGGVARLATCGKQRVVVLASREHHCLAELLVRNQFENDNAQIVAVLSNHERLRSLTEQFSVPFHFIPSEGKPREEHESEVLKLAHSFAPECLVLAKYMRVLTPEFVRQFPRRIINIHHSFLPAFIGAKPYHQAWQRGVKVIGATAHFVTDNLDEGPIIAQQVIPVDHSFSATDMARAGQDIEKVVLARAVRLVLENRVFLSGNRTVIFE